MLLIVNYEKIGDGIEYFYPMAVSLIHPSEEASILQGDGCMPYNRLQQLFVFLTQGAVSVGQAKHSNQLLLRTMQRNQGEIMPAQRRSQSRADQLASDWADCQSLQLADEAVFDHLCKNLQIGLRSHDDVGPAALALDLESHAFCFAKRPLIMDASLENVSGPCRRLIMVASPVAPSINI